MLKDKERRALRRMVLFGTPGGFIAALSTVFSDYPRIFGVVAFLGCIMVLTAVYYMTQISFTQINASEEREELRRKAIRRAVPDLEEKACGCDIHFVRCMGIAPGGIQEVGRVRDLTISDETDNHRYNAVVHLHSYGYDVFVFNESQGYKWRTFFSRVPHPDDARREDNDVWDVVWIAENEKTIKSRWWQGPHKEVEQEIIDIVRVDTFFRLR